MVEMGGGGRQAKAGVTMVEAGGIRQAGEHTRTVEEMFTHLTPQNCRMLTRGRQDQRWVGGEGPFYRLPPCLNG